MQLGLLMHNDCSFVAQHLTAMHTYQRLQDIQRAASAATTVAAASSASAVPAAAVAAGAAKVSMLVDLAPPLSALGGKFLSLHVRRLRVLVAELSDSLAARLGSLEGESAWHGALQDTKRTLHQMATAEKAWQKCMGGSSVLRAAGAAATFGTAPSNGWPLLLGLLLEQLSSRLVATVLDKADISVEGGKRALDPFR